MEMAYLIKLDVDENNNRYYRMIPDNSSPTFTVEMGRVGATPVRSKKPISLWAKIYAKKIAEGYEDRAKQYESIATVSSKYLPIEDKEVEQFVNDLTSYANKVLDASYTISYQDVTPDMILDVQNLINELAENQGDIRVCNDLLQRLFIAIPRKMKNVKDYLITDPNKVPDVIIREQELLDVMAAKVNQSETQKENLGVKGTVLDSLGLSIRTCDDKEIAQIKRKMSKESAPFFKRAFRVNNHKTDKRFEAYMEDYGMNEEDIHYYYHGSRNGNYFGLMTQGPKLNPNAPITGKMFGYGIYFANRAKKSINYTDLRGSYWARGTDNKAYLAIYKVCYKDALHVQSWRSNMSSFTKARIAPHDALYAHKGADLVNDEIIVYDERQMTLQYIVELEG